MRSLFVTITFICLYISTTNGDDVPGVRLRELLQSDSCCSKSGEERGLVCGCRAACSGSDCSSGANFGISATCGTGVCCCGNTCRKPLKPELDICPTSDPTVSPSANPSKNPSKNPTVSPTANPSTNPSINPTINPSVHPTLSPSANPSVAPTVPQCADWPPETQESDTPNPSTDSTDIPVPDISLSPQLCQIGKSGEWNSLDKWYSWDCSCYDRLTLFSLSQLIQGWFVEFQLNYLQRIEGRFESYFNNYCSDNIFFETSLSERTGGQGRDWNGLDDLTSCDPSNPGYGELSRNLMETSYMDFQVVPGGVFMKDCTNGGTLATARININNYRLFFFNTTEDLVVFGDFTVEKQQNSNTWLIKEIIFTGNPVGFLQQSQ